MVEAAVSRLLIIHVGDRRFVEFIANLVIGILVAKLCMICFIFTFASPEALVMVSMVSLVKLGLSTGMGPTPYLAA